VACAGISSGPILDTEDRDWRYVVETNFMGYVACAREAAIRMQGEGGGHIVFISSISSEFKRPGDSVYAATKAGVDTFAETLRKELAESNVKVSIIQPGTVGTDMVDAEAKEQRRMINKAEMLAAEDIADAVLYILTRAHRTDIVTLRIEPQLQKIG
jgi:3-hydroxy acid dehydrogenase / malonic semialdehyde reductase